MSESIEATIGSILQDGDEPVYVTYDALNRQLDSPIDLASFFKVVEGMVYLEEIALYQFVRRSSGNILKRERFVPDSLLAQYLIQNHKDPAWDPFDLYLSLRKRDPEIIVR